MINNIITLEEAARWLKVAPITLYRKARAGEVPAAKLGRSWRFHRGQLEEWVREQASAASRRDQVPSLGRETAFRHLSSREADAVQRFLQKLERSFPRQIDRIVLYGSRARGDFREDSDIDLAIILNSPNRSMRKQISMMSSETSFEEAIVLQAVVFSKEEWGNPSFKTFLLVERIQREGIRIDE